MPRELAVIGVDNDPCICEHATPTLTSILLDHERAGHLAAELRFREVMGRSILDEILSVRIERAKHLLEHSSKSVAQIASDCGYGSANALRKVFEPLVGMTPRAWRKAPCVAH